MNTKSFMFSECLLIQKYNVENSIKHEANNVKYQNICGKYFGKSLVLPMRSFLMSLKYRNNHHKLAYNASSHVFAHQSLDRLLAFSILFISANR